MSWRALVLATVLVVAPSCAPREARPEAASVLRTLEIGAHQVQVDVPAGWDVIDQGSQKRFLKAGLELVLHDLGPVTPQGVRREVESARDLWKAGRAGEARLRLSNTRVPPALFPSADTRQTFQSTWYTFARSVGETPFNEVEPAFNEILARVEELPPRDLAALADWGLATVGHDQRRDVKSRRGMTLDAREAVDIETWNRLAHTNPKRLLFVVDDGDLMVLYTPREADAESATAFESIRDSLHFVSAGVTVTAR